MSNYPPGVTDADIDEHFGEAMLRDEYEEALDRARAAWEEQQDTGPEGLDEFLDRERATAYYERYEEH